MKIIAFFCLLFLAAACTEEPKEEIEEKDRHYEHVVKDIELSTPTNIFLKWKIFM